MQQSFHFPHDTNQNFYSFHKKHSVHDFTISPQISPFKCDLLCSQHEVWCPDWGHKGVAAVFVTLSGKQRLTLLSKAVFGFSALFAEAARSLLSRRSLMSPWPSALPRRSAHKWDLLCTGPACLWGRKSHPAPFWDLPHGWELLLGRPCIPNNVIVLQEGEAGLWDVAGRPPHPRVVWKGTLGLVLGGVEVKHNQENWPKTKEKGILA